MAKAKGREIVWYSISPPLTLVLLLLIPYPLLISSHCPRQIRCSLFLTYYKLLRPSFVPVLMNLWRLLEEDCCSFLIPAPWISLFHLKENQLRYLSMFKKKIAKTGFYMKFTEHALWRLCAPIWFNLFKHSWLWLKGAENSAWICRSMLQGQAQAFSHHALPGVEAQR